jgi:hypothetical protein
MITIKMTAGIEEDNKQKKGKQPNWNAYNTIILFTAGYLCVSYGYADM